MANKMQTSKMEVLRNKTITVQAIPLQGQPLDQY